jgi:hypothetical protein
MMTREPKRGGWGQKVFLKNHRYECDKGEETNTMEYVSNNGAKKSRIFFFPTCGVIL